MALINCPECNNEISDKSDSCPYCGLPSRYYAKKSTKEEIKHENEKPGASVRETDKSYIKSSTAAVAGNTPEELNIINIKNKLSSFKKEYKSLFSGRKYLEKSRIKEFKEKYDLYYKALQDIKLLQYIDNNLKEYGIRQGSAANMIKCIKNLNRDANEYNLDFVEKKIKKHKKFFDTVLDEIDPGITLDEDQRRAIVTEEDYCLIIAGAGAGKTTTMAAKVKYLVEKLKVDPKDIILISFTNKAVNELKERVNRQLKIPANVTTFHSFGYEILKKTKSTVPNIVTSSYNDVFNVLEKTVYKDNKLLKKLLLFFGYYMDMPETVMEFDTLEKYHEYKANLDYETLKSSLHEYNQKVMDLRSRHVRTINGEFLRSVQEVQIANFLYLNNIEYEYEKPYRYPAGGRKKYTPDFCIKQGDNYCYIEHFGIGENGSSSLYNEKQLAKYKSGINYKIKLHRKYNTPLITTFSWYLDGSDMLDKLKGALIKRGFVLKKKKDEEVYRHIVKKSKDKYMVRFVLFLIEFIKNYKSNGYNERTFAYLKRKTKNVRTKMFIDIAKRIYMYYQKSIKEKNCVDFEDMINEAEKVLKKMENEKTDIAYRYIIIDEYQDIARQRFNLAKRLSDVCSAKVIAVGDDWQSIFAFAGADINLFLKFKKLMGYGEELKIRKTYRNSQELIDIAGNFIQKNTKQIKKRLISDKSLPRPVIVKVYNDSYNIMANKVKAIEEAIHDIMNEYGNKSTILLIGRYNFDAYNLVKTGNFKEKRGGKLISTKYPGADITFMTAHSSKGLGFDNVIIINAIEGKFGFPSQIEDDPIMKLVITDDTNIEFAEERRLFYVALTRTKNKVYVAAPQNKPSRFLIELINEYDIPVNNKINKNISYFGSLSKRCPVCGFPLKKEYNKNYGLMLYMCTNEPEVCDFMTNSIENPADIFKCPKCRDGYMIVKKSNKNNSFFYGCTEYRKSGKGCSFTYPIMQ